MKFFKNLWGQLSKLRREPSDCECVTQAAIDRVHCRINELSEAVETLTDRVESGTMIAIKKWIESVNEERKTVMPLQSELLRRWKADHAILIEKIEGLKAENATLKMQLSDMVDPNA